MPKIYRTMFDQGGRPLVGNAFCELGIRPTDVDVDGRGNVALNGNGMSVFRSLADLPRLCSRLVPIHLARKVRGAAGPTGTRVWTMGAGPFVSAPLAGNLALREAGGLHGTICPTTAMTTAAFQSELAATQGSWAIDEP